LIFLLFLRLPLVSTLVPYTTLFRSSPQAANRMLHPFDKKNMDLLFCLCGVPASTETQPPAAAALSSQGYCHGGRGRCGCTWPGVLASCCWCLRRARRGAGSVPHGWLGSGTRPFDGIRVPNSCCRSRSRTFKFKGSTLMATLTTPRPPAQLAPRRRESALHASPGTNRTKLPARSEEHTSELQSREN